MRNEFSLYMYMNLCRENTPIATQLRLATWRLYTPSKDKLTCSKATQALIKHLKATYVYRHAQSFCRVRIMIVHVRIIYTMSQHTYMWVLWSLFCIQCRDTYWVESFNHQMLTPDANVTYSLFVEDIFNANEFGRPGLGKYNIFFYPVLYCYFISLCHYRMRMWIVRTLVWKRSEIYANLQWRCWWRRPTILLIYCELCLPKTRLIWGRYM